MLKIWNAVNQKHTGAVILALCFFAPFSYSSPLNYPDSGSAFVTAGAEARCEGPSDIDPSHASCSADGFTAMASADLPLAEIKVMTGGAGPAYFFEAQAGFVDLITVTDGWDENGLASGSFNLAVDGIFDISSPDYESEANFFIAIWGTDDSTPTCIYDADDCGFYLGPYDYAEVWFDLFNGAINADIFSSGTGSGSILSIAADDLGATLSVDWTASIDNPSFYIAAMGLAATPGTGLTDFYNTASANLVGPDGFQYTSSNGFAGSSSTIPLPDSLALVALGFVCFRLSRKIPASQGYCRF